MLRLAVHKVNALRPRFVLISGDLTNAWPCEENARIVEAQVVHAAQRLQTTHERGAKWRRANMERPPELSA